MALTLINPTLPTANSSGLRRLGTSGETPNASAANRPAANPDCQTCGGSGWQPVLVEGVRLHPLQIGPIRPATKLRRCDCLRESIRRIKLAAIPRHYRMADLATVEPDPARHSLQGELFETMRREPTSSYILCGANGCGKTMAGWMLYRHAVEHDTPAVGVSCSDLVDQFRAWQFDDSKMPVIEPDNLRSDTRRFVFIDEIDKARPTEFAATTLNELIDAAYSWNHQLVITSNTPLEGLAEYWSRNAVTIGPSIVRRLMEIENGNLVDMF